MKIDLSCPVELWQYQLPDKEYPACVFLMYNLSLKTVVSIQATLIAYNEEGEQAGRLVERVQDIVGEAKKTFDMVIFVDPQFPSYEMELVVEKVWFEDGTIWRRNNQQQLTYTPNLLPNGRDLEMLRFVAGNDAVGYPQDQGALWLCVCGRANAAREEVCRRCMRSKEMVFTQYDPEAIKELMEQREQELEKIAKAAREEASARQLKREEKRAIAQKKKKRTLIAVSSVAGAVVIGLGTYFYGIPLIHYKKGENALKEELFDEARQQFLTVENFKDAQEMLLETDYQEGNYYIKVDTMESLEKAIVLFDSLEEYKDATEKGYDVRYTRAEKLFAQKKYDEAVQAFDEISNYSNAKNRKNEVLFEQGKMFFNQGDYDDAYNIFATLGDHPQANAYADDSLYERGIELTLQKNFDEAIEKLKSLEETTRGKKALTEAYYGKAEKLEAEKNYSEAGEYYLLCGDYSNAPSGVNRCIYEPAVALMDEGNYEEAIGLFSNIMGYSDAAEKLNECKYQVAMRHLENREYQIAYEKFMDINTYSDAQDLANEALLSQIKEAFDSENYTEVLTLLDKLDGYEEEKEEYLNQSHYQMGLEYMQKNEYTKAIEAFEKVIDYSDSGEKIKQAQLAIGNQAFEDGDYEKALEEYQSAADDKQTEEKMLEIQYAMALEKIKNKEYTKGIELLEEMVDYKQAGEKLQQARYEYSKTLIADGFYTGAIDVLKALGNYEDAETLLKQCYYVLATGAQKDNDLALAGSYFAQAGDYEDAAEKSTQAYEEYFAGSMDEAKKMMEGEDYQGVIDLLKGLDLEFVPKSYQNIVDFYNEANYIMANDLYNAGKPYEALQYYQNIPNYKDVGSSKLQRNTYLIIGNWLSDSGVKMIFRQDGSCSIDGEEGYYLVNRYSMYTGKTPGELNVTHKVTRLVGDSLSLRYIENDSDTMYKLTRQSGE